MAILVALLDYCMGEEEFHVPKEQIERAENVLRQQKRPESEQPKDNDHEKVVDGEDKKE